MRLIILTTFALSLTAETAPAQLTTEERLRMENVSLKEALIQAQYRELQTEKQRAFAAPCERLKIALDRCKIDPQTGTVAEKPLPPKPAALQK